MARSPKSELEKYLDGLVVSLRIQALKRPESWLKWGGIALGAFVYAQTDQLWTFLAIGLGCAIPADLLAWRRLGARNIFEVGIRTAEARIPFVMRTLARKGQLEEKLGLEAVAILESTARGANALIATVAKAQILDGGGLAMNKHFRPLTEAMETLTIAALVSAYQPVLVRQMPGEETLAKLREYESGICDLLAQVKEIAQEQAPSKGISDEASRVIEEIQARKELRETDELGESA